MRGTRKVSSTSYDDARLEFNEVSKVFSEEDLEGEEKEKR
jgi:hypothetical protein